MEIKIIEDSTLGNIQREFQSCYPYLKLQFYQYSNGQHVIAHNTDLPADEITHKCHLCKINISPKRTVAAVEHDFLHTLGLQVQILRQSGNVWIETTHTDSWTLQQQNDTAKEMSVPLQEQHPEDFDLQDVD